MVGLVQGRVALGQRILLVDHESALVYPDDMSDMLHPNDNGYQKMSQVWFDGLASFLPVCVTSAPSFTSQPPSSASLGIEYRYLPNILARPVGEFTLLNAPSGMNIHPDTGEIRWVPATSGQFPVDIQVQNAQGNAVQSTILEVP
jgi:hypothetical protein